MATIYTRVESPRGCGYRKKGGMYLVSDGIGKACCRLPIELTVCPCCGEGIKQNRGFSWISGALIGDAKFPELCGDCVLSSATKKSFALMWVGEKYYKTTLEFTREAMARGVSKRIAMIPHKLKIGETWVLLAHPKAIATFNRDTTNAKVNTGFAPGIFQAFRPTRIEYIITGDETHDELEDLERRGLTLINVVRDVDMQGNINHIQNLN